MIKRSDGWFTYYKCIECKHKMFLDKNESLPVKCPNCRRIILKKKHCHPARESYMKYKADCPICGGKLINHNEGMICDTCDFYIDNEGFEHVEGWEN